MNSKERVEIRCVDGPADGLKLMVRKGVLEVTVVGADSKRHRYEIFRDGTARLKKKEK